MTGRKFALSIAFVISAASVPAVQAADSGIAKAANPKFSLFAKNGPGYKYMLANTGAGLQVFTTRVSSGRYSDIDLQKPARNPQRGPYSNMGTRTPATYYAGRARGVKAKTYQNTMPKAGPRFWVNPKH